MKRMHIHLTEQQLARLQKLSERNGLNIAEMMRRAVDNYLDEEEAKDNLMKVSQKSDK